jgi:hypothetical protein
VLPPGRHTGHNGEAWKWHVGEIGAVPIGRVRWRLGATALLVPVALLSSGCSGGQPRGSVGHLGSATVSPPMDRSSSTKAKGFTVAFSACMRSHGEPGFPDPVIGPRGYGIIRIPRSDGIDPGSAQYRSAERACTRLLGPVPAVFVSSSQEQSEWLGFAACVRRHGEPTFPDPTFPKGVMQIDWRGGDMSFPRFRSAVRSCASLEPRGAPPLP